MAFGLLPAWLASRTDVNDALKQAGLTAADIRRVANSVLRSPIQAAIIGPFTRESAFRAALDA